MMTFCAKLGNYTFQVIYCGYFLGNIRKNYDYFLFQHLVTLIGK